MRGKTKIISLAAMLSIISITSVVFASGLIDVSRTPLLGYTPILPDAGETVFINPSKIIHDYINDPGYQIGNTLMVHVNVSSVTDLFAYQVNVTWSPSMLNYTGVTYGDFLARTGSSYGTSRIEPTVFASNVTGFASIAETILGNVGGISGGGRLFTIHFKIIGYGSTSINLSGAGTLPTTLLNSAGGTMAFTATGGFFRNKLIGDIDGDHDVDGVDFGQFAPKYGSSGPLGYTECDLDYDGDVDGIDFGLFAPNYGRSF
jgi:hypothetical protein